MLGPGLQGIGCASSVQDGNATQGHTSSVLTLQWMPHSSSVLTSGGEDCALLIWDVSGANTENSNSLVFVHPGHRHTVVDIDWNEHSPGTLASVSEPTDGGSKLQLK